MATGYAFFCTFTAMRCTGQASQSAREEDAAFRHRFLPRHRLGGVGFGGPPECVSEHEAVGRHFRNDCPHGALQDPGDVSPRQGARADDPSFRDVHPFLALRAAREERLRQEATGAEGSEVAATTASPPAPKRRAHLVPPPSGAIHYWSVATGSDKKPRPFRPPFSDWPTAASSHVPQTLLQSNPRPTLARARRRHRLRSRTSRYSTSSRTTPRRLTRGGSTTAARRATLGESRGCSAA